MSPDLKLVYVNIKNPLNQNDTIFSMKFSLVKSSGFGVVLALVLTILIFCAIVYRIQRNQQRQSPNKTI